MLNFDPLQHDYVEHSTYTGPDCAICGRSVAEHASMLITREMPRAEAMRRYPELFSQGTQSDGRGQSVINGGSERTPDV